MSESAAIDAAGDALEQTRRALFPFSFERWLVLGLAAFLDQCGRGGFGGTLPTIPPGGGGGGPMGLPESVTAPDMERMLPTVALVAAVVVLVILAFVLLALWVGSRGIFVYAHCVATGRVEIAAPWRAHARKANSLFLWRLGLAGAVIAALLGIVAAGAAVALTARGDGPGVAHVAFAVVAMAALFLLVAAASFGSMALRDFVAPLQLATGTGCGPAVRLLLDLVRAHPVAFFLYILLKIVLGIVQGVVVLAAACLTCCVVLLPVVAQTVLQPVFYFERAWPIHLLKRLGHDVTTSDAFRGYVAASSGISHHPIP
ncbi:MAG TPA: hypothetical protein VFM29_06265 [Vicinamibacteria bacterium]|nr:hypothetical protein [Vicinamibacteria bacterium]